MRRLVIAMACALNPMLAMFPAHAGESADYIFEISRQASPERISQIVDFVARLSQTTGTGRVRFNAASRAGTADLTKAAAKVVAETNGIILVEFNATIGPPRSVEFERLLEPRAPTAQPPTVRIDFNPALASTLADESFARVIELLADVGASEIDVRDQTKTIVAVVPREAIARLKKVPGVRDVKRLSATEVRGLGCGPTLR